MITNERREADTYKSVKINYTAKFYEALNQIKNVKYSIEILVFMILYFIISYPHIYSAKFNFRENSFCKKVNYFYVTC